MTLSPEDVTSFENQVGGTRPMYPTLDKSLGESRTVESAIEPIPTIPLIADGPPTSSP
jgi:hypothetical protein